MSLAFDLQDGRGGQLWVPGMPPPLPLFEHIAAGRLIEAWNSSFEYWVWRNICHARMGWPELPLHQLRDAMAKARAYAWPGELEAAAKVSNAAVRKMTGGKRLIGIFGRPHNPTQRRSRLRILAEDAPQDFAAYCHYNLLDIAAESAVSELTPDLSLAELNLWLLDQQINVHGCPIDTDSLRGCIAILDAAAARYTRELQDHTGGAVQSAAEVKKIREWLAQRDADPGSLEADVIDAALAEDDAADWQTKLPYPTRRVLEIRRQLGAASVKKCYTMARQLSAAGRLHDLFTYCGADRTGRFSGRGAQPQNLPKAGPKVLRCECGRHFRERPVGWKCPWCGCDSGFAAPAEWSVDAVEDALTVIRSHQLQHVETFFGEALAVVSGCLRGLFVAAPGHDLVCADYSAIEAVVLAMLSGEQWRIEVFRTHGRIYEESASRITGVPFAEFMAHKQRTGQHHPLRNKIGKYAELASGYQGHQGAWLKFGAGQHLTNEEIVKHVTKWREQSPAIVNFWYGLERAAHAAVRAPGQAFAYRGICYQMSERDALHCRLPSGRLLTYHQPRLVMVERFERPQLQLAYMGWNTDTTKGPRGWIRMLTYGGRLTENVVQAVARDILTNAMPRVAAAGYQIVLHVHDELATMVPEGWGSVEELSQLMCSPLPTWAADWPVRASGWRGKRYRKD
jgi:DNA polymerase